MNHYRKWPLVVTCFFLPMGCALARVSIAGESTALKLVNPSFENVGDASDRAAGWERWGDWFNREEGWKPVRTGSCLLGYHHWEIPGAADSGVYQDVAGVRDGQPHTFGIYVSADKAKPPTKDPQTIELRLESTVAGHQQTLAKKVYQVADVPPDAWQKLTVSGTPTNSTLRVLVIVTPSPAEGSRGGALRFDDAFLELTNGSSPP